MMNRKGKVGNAFCHLYLIILSLIAFFPLVWVLLCSVKPSGELTSNPREEHFLVHESQEEDDDRTRIYHGTEMDGAIMYGKPGKKPPMWLHSIMKNEMKYLNGILHGKEADDEFRPLLTGEAARAAIATADACTKSRFEDRKVKLSEIIG